MPAIRNALVRRSRRLSNHPSQAAIDPNVGYAPKPEPRSPSAQTPPTSIGAPSPTSDPSSILSTPLAREVIAASPALTCLVNGQSYNFDASHGRRRKEGYIPRPPNCFMVYRSHFWAKEKAFKDAERNHSNISCLAGGSWRELTNTQRELYRAIAREAQRLHSQRYPDYKYQPASRKDKTSRRARRTGKVDKERRNQVAALLMSDVKGEDLEIMDGELDAEGDDSPGTEVADLPLGPEPTATPRPTPTSTSTPTPTSTSTLTPTSTSTSTLTPTLQSLSVHSDHPSLFIPTCISYNGGDDDRYDDRFIPTADISPLDLSMSIFENETVNYEQSPPDPSIQSSYSGIPASELFPGVIRPQSHHASYLFGVFELDEYLFTPPSSSTQSVSSPYDMFTDGPVSFTDPWASAPLPFSIRDLIAPAEDHLQIPGPDAVPLVDTIGDDLLRQWTKFD